MTKQKDQKESENTRLKLQEILGNPKLWNPFCKTPNFPNELDLHPTWWLRLGALAAISGQLRPTPAAAGEVQPTDIFFPFFSFLLFFLSFFLSFAFLSFLPSFFSFHFLFFSFLNLRLLLPHSCVSFSASPAFLCLSIFSCFSTRRGAYSRVQVISQTRFSYSCVNAT